MRTNGLPWIMRRAGDVLAAGFNSWKFDQSAFFGVGDMERVVRSMGASAESAARACSGIAVGMGLFSEILQSAAALEQVLGKELTGGGGEGFSANREITDRDSSARGFSIDFDMSGGIALVWQYYEALEAARAAVGEFKENTNGAYDITLSFGGILGGTIAVALAALGSSVIWLRELCLTSIAGVSDRAAWFAGYFGNMWDNPVSKAVARFAWFGGSALSVIGAVRSYFGSISDMALPEWAGTFFSKDTLGGSGAGSSFFGSDNIGSTALVYGALSVLPETSSQRELSGISFFGNTGLNGANTIGGGSSADYIRYDETFAAGYAIGDILMRMAGGGYSNTTVNNNIDRISANVSGISENVGKAAAATEISGEELKFLRDVAARDVINRFTTAQVSVSMGGVTNNLSGTADLDGIVDYLASGVKTALENAAEGVHS